VRDSLAALQRRTSRPRIAGLFRELA
jgi:hypothetical protein